MTDARPQKSGFRTFGTFFEFRVALAFWLNAAHHELEVWLDEVDATGAVVPPVYQYPEEGDEWVDF